MLTPDPAAFESRRLLAAPLAGARRLTLDSFVGERRRVELEREGSGWRSRDGALSPVAARSLAARLAALEPLDRIWGRAGANFPGPSNLSILSVEWDGAHGGSLGIHDFLDPTRRFGRITGRKAIYIFAAADIDSLVALLTGH